ncbi:MAG: hypothetical protein K8U03_20000 [Planctomycetia bacterium]|nr:hypothetical protein [Planctomycetia bacterium]
MSKTPGPWQLDGTSGRLDIVGFQATLDLAQPRLGLRMANSAAAVLGLQLGTSLVDSSAVEPAESYVRGADLVATYNQTEARPLRVQAYWHVAALAHSFVARDARLIELQVSINTTLLDLRPTIDVVTQLNSPVEKLTFGEASAWLVRFADRPYTYIEIPHPRDCARTAFEPAAAGRTTLRHTLFGRKLEKGVIMRGRVRGALVPRADDVATAEALVDDLLNAAPPLTT